MARPVTTFTKADSVAPPEPTPADLDGIVQDLQTSWKAQLTIRRQSPNDIGYREVLVTLDDRPLTSLKFGEEFTCEIEPGRHRLLFDNTLFRKKLDVTVSVGDHLCYRATNRAGFGTYSLAIFLGGGPIYLSVEREELPSGR